ncbi:four helix bundle protein [Echinicola rosea]|uniref:Four helix bundle protein n=1 Tax=Echinicola rosea TaxID=1807691 RepID=A0ABQ1VB43_9BACT|nr:four helix bundle protein [Echinicola rosea]GGF47909.1 hypothetical protein GCM10011339_40600 [Echinicola rosea]
MDYVERFKDLKVYKASRQLSWEIFKVIKYFPNEETYSLTDQVRRSSRSLKAQIAEAWEKRNYEKHFISKLIDADVEQLETQHCIETALDCKYPSGATSDYLRELYKSIGKMHNAM